MQIKRFHIYGSVKNSLVLSVSLLAFVLLISCHRSEYPLVLINTDLGAITLEVYPDKAPITANNFLRLLEQDVYTDAIFYRVVRMDNQPDNEVRIEVIQGGLFEDDIIEGFPAIAHETTEMTGILHKDGVISMARLGPGTASTEFFICVGDQPSLDYGGERNPDGQGFAAFGQVVKGMDVVREIQAMPDSGQMLLKPVKILKIEVVR